MSSRKYRKFGLRADRALADLTDSGTALANVINDLTSVNDIDGNPTGFTLSDIEPLRIFSQSDLDETYDYTQPGVPPYALTDLKDTRPFIDIADPNDPSIITSKPIQPQVTMQDYLNKFKTVFGDPPFVNGGSGPVTEIIPTERINSSSQQIGSIIDGDDVISGQRYKIVTNNNSDAQWDTLSGASGGSYSVGDIFTASIDGTSTYSSSSVRNVSLPRASYAFAIDEVAANQLKPTELHTKIFNAEVPAIITPEDYWPSTGDFFYPSKLDISFSDRNGAVQHTGYQDGGFNAKILITGCFLVEEDLIENESVESNWRFVRGTLQPEFRAYETISYETVDGKTVLTCQSNGHDWSRVGLGMTVTFDNTTDPATGSNYTSVVESMSRTNFKITLVDDFNITDATGTDEIIFSFSPKDDEIEFPSLGITAPNRGARRRVRYTHYWPSVAKGGTASGVKKAEETNNTEFGYTRFYPIQQTQDFSSKRYSYPFFRDNRAGPTNEKADFELKVINTLRNEFTPSLKSSSVTQSTLFDSANNEIVSHTLSLNSSGRHQEAVATSKIGGVNKGDVVVLKPPGANNYWAFKVEITSRDSDYHYISLPIEFFDLTNIAPDTAFEVLIIKNEGLVGVFKYADNDSGAGVEHQIQTINRAPKAFGSFANTVTENDLIYKVNFTGASGANSDINEYGFRVKSTDHYGIPASLESIITIENNPESSVTDINATDGVVVVHRSRGISDRSTIQECNGVIGKEVMNTYQSGAQSIVVSDVDNITPNASASLADFIYFDGVIPHGTTVTAVDTSTKTVTLSAPISGALVKGSTVVFVSRSAGEINNQGVPTQNGWNGENKEYCIIPLNTAPPWESTTKGLKTPPNRPNVIAKELRFSKLSFTLPENSISEIAGGTIITTDKYMPITYTAPGG